MSYLKLITPINLPEEKKRFFSVDNYSPQFIYAWESANLRNLSEKEEKLLSALRSQKSGLINAYAKSFLGAEFKDRDLEFAKKSIKVTPGKTSVNVQEYAALARQEFKEYGIDYKIEIVDKHGFQGRPDHKNKILRLSKYLKPEFYSAEGLVKHELVHIIRAINGEYNGIKPQDKYLGTEEGLAAYVQDGLLKSQTASLYQHSVEYLAAHVAKDEGFLPVYNFMIDNGSSPESAWLRGIRQKFGIKDTSKPGSLMKSAMQFCYEMKIKLLTDEQLLKLFVGKIRIDQIETVKEYRGKFSKETIKDLLNVSE